MENVEAQKLVSGQAKKRYKSFVFATVLGPVILLAISNCVAVAPVTQPGELLYFSLKPGDYERLDYVQGSSCAGRYLMFFQFDSPNVFKAMTAALAQDSRANFLLNREVSFQEEFVVPILYHRLCLYIQGRAVYIKSQQREAL